MSRPVVELPEWATATVEGAVLTEGDRLLVERLASGAGARIVVDELRSGVRIAARSWVGVISLDAFEIQVVPKLAGDNLGLVRMIEFATGLGALRRIDAVRTLAAERTDRLLDLLALLLVEAGEELIRRGLLHDYVEREDELPVVRGRFLADRQALQRFGRVDRLVCRYDEHEPDIPENQLLTLAFRKCGPLVRDESIRFRVRRLWSLFSEICDPAALDLASARSDMVYHRLNEHYQEAHGLAWLILDALGVEDVLEPGTTRSFAFLIDMNALFERFVYRLLERLLAGSRVRLRYQHRDRSIIWDEDAARPYTSVVPDLLIEGPPPGRWRLPVDAKYKLYDEKDVGSGDIYQSFLYAYAYGPTGEAMPTGVIVYPSSSGTHATHRLSVRKAEGLRGARIAVIGLPIVTALDEIESGAPGPIAATVVDAIGMGVPRAPTLVS